MTREQKVQNEMRSAFIKIIQEHKINTHDGMTLMMNGVFSILHDLGTFYGEEPTEFTINILQQAIDQLKK